MTTQATLVYTVAPVPPVLLTRLQPALAAVPLDLAAIQTMTGCTFTSDTTSNDGTNALRTIVFGLPTAFQKNFPTAAGNQAYAFNNLYTHAIGATLGSIVKSSVVIV